jgi:pyridoxal phosphate enzyme (YggS family)
MIKDKIMEISAALPKGVRLVAVSKTKPNEDILEAYDAGQRLFGENYATELRDKAVGLPKDIQWHFIGHLQGKQLKYYIPFVSMIHGVDSLTHLEEVDRAAAKVERVVNVLLQVHVAQEETKFGFLPEEIETAEIQSVVPALKNVRICGVMGMASHTDDQARVRSDFRRIRQIYEQLHRGVFAGNEDFCEVSMGMSHDWPIAVEEGSTMVRIGSSIFGPRNYFS